MTNNQDSLFKFLTGSAGVGKSFKVMELVNNDTSFGILASSSGVSAVNLGTTTIHSLLGYFNTASLYDKFIEGKLQSRLKQLQKSYSYIILDEISMIEAEQLDIICSALDQINEDSEKKIGLLIVGDFFQLAPVEGKWAFQASCWNDKFSSNIEYLTKVWRQDNLDFVEALNLARLGKGKALISHFNNLKVEFCSIIDTEFEGTTIFSKNMQVDSYNTVRHMRLKGKEISTYRKIEGKSLGEWNKIPEILKLKIGSYVMILYNKSLGYENGISTGFEFSNGDCCYIEDFQDEQFICRLVRNNEIVKIPKITRYNETKHKPSVFEEVLGSFEPYYDDERKKWILGKVEFFPLRLAYASTVHKVQGLSLDKVQISMTNHFMGFNNMSYVSLSRARTIEGLRLVCPKESLLEKRVNVDPLVLNWYNNLIK